MAALLYAPTLGFGFAYDDAAVVVNHPQVTGHDWRAIFASPYHVGQDVRVQTGAYRPLTIASFALNHRVSGTSPLTYHLVGVLLHALTSAAVVLLAVELGLTPFAGAVGALAFAAHPVHVEAVANVAGRAELLSTALAVSALLAYARRRLVVFSALFGAALFAKENVVTILGVVALWEALRPVEGSGNGLRARAASAIAPLTAAAVPIAAYLAARLAVLGALGLAPGSVTSIENPVVGLSLVPREATVLAVFARAASLLLTPIRLAPDYGYAEIVPSTSLLAPGPVVGALILAATLAFIVRFWRRAPLAAFLLGAMLATYAIVSNAFVIIGTVLGDRLLYLPSVFFCMLLGLAAKLAGDRAGRWVSAAGAGLLLLALSARAAAYAAVWRDDATLFAYAARIAPQSVRALGGWGEVLGESGRFGEARSVLDRAVAIAPDFIPNRLNRAATALSLGDLDLAYADARHVLELEPGNVAAARLMAAIARRTGVSPGG